MTNQLQSERVLVALLIASLTMLEAKCEEFVFSKQVADDLVGELVVEEQAGLPPTDEEAAAILRIRPDAEFIIPDHVNVYRLFLKHQETSQRYKAWQFRVPHVNGYVSQPEFSFLDLTLTGSNLLLLYKSYDRTYAESLSLPPDWVGAGKHIEDKEKGESAPVNISKDMVFRDRQGTRGLLAVVRGEFRETTVAKPEIELQLTFGRLARLRLGSTGNWTEFAVDYQLRQNVVVNSTTEVDVEVFAAAHQIESRGLTVKGGVSPPHAKVWVNTTAASVNPTNGLWRAEHVAVTNRSVPALMIRAVLDP